MNTKVIGFTLFIVAVVIAVAIIISDNKEQDLVATGNESVPCLPNGHQQVAQHIHPVLSIVVDGEPEIIPANLGIEGICMREVHTHDKTGTVHIETALPDKNYALADFFTVWGQSIEREGYDMSVTQDGEPVDSPLDLVLVDHANILIEYTSQIN